jgi:hypothetical protein
MVVRARITLSLNIASLALGLLGAGFAAYPAFSPFHGQELKPFTADNNGPLPKTPAFEEWQTRNDRLSRWGLFLVALGTATAAAAQIIESRKSSSAPARRSGPE